MTGSGEENLLLDAFHSPESIDRDFQRPLHSPDPPTSRNVRKTFPRDQYTRKIS